MAKGVYVGVGSITYTELEYIESSGTQYIDTGFVPNQDSEMELDFAVNAVDGTDNYLVGQRDTTTSKNFSFLVNAGGKFRFGYNTVVNDAGTADANRHTLKIEKNVLSMDGSEVVTATYAAFTGYGNMWICGINQTAGARYGKMKVYSCKLYDNGTLVRDFVPCQSSAGAIGLYDKVEGKFYANAGSGTFTAGTAGETIATTGIAQKVKKMYVGVGDVARKIKKGYVGIGGVARPFFSGGELAYYGTLSGAATNRGMATTVGNYALFNGGSLSANVYAYNPSLTMTTPTALSRNFYDGAATTVGNYAVFAGGMYESGDADDRNSYVSPYVTSYNTSLTRTTRTNLEHQRWNLAGASAGSSYAIFAGGYDSRSRNYTDAYSSSMTKVSDIDTINQMCHNLSGVSFGNYAVFGGGYYAAGETDRSNVYTYNTSLTRTIAATLSTARSSMAATSLGDYVFFAGGWVYSSQATSKVVDVYNSAFTKITVNALSQARRDLAATSVGKYALFGGGYTGSGRSAVVDVYDGSLTKTTTTSLSATKQYLAATMIGNYAIFSGGTGATNTFDVYTVA